MIQYTSANMRMWSRLGASGAFGAAAMELGESDENAVIVSADMSFASGLERFKAKYPERHFEVGIAEQNLVGAAAGMASEGLLPYAVTYATFLATRALDQVKMCLGYMRQNVKLIGMLSGFGAGILGPTHMSLEDIAAMRAIPNMTVLCPADGAETIKALLAAAQMQGPVYIRMAGGLNLPAVYKEDYPYIIGQAIPMRSGKDVSIFATGTMVHYSLLAANLLMEQGIDCTVINMHTVKPLDTQAIDDACDAKLIVTVEEHSVIGGLGAAAAEHLSRCKEAPPLLRIGVEDFYPHAGSYEALLKECGLDAEGIARTIRERYMQI